MNQGGFKIHFVLKVISAAQMELGAVVLETTNHSVAMVTLSQRDLVSHVIINVVDASNHVHKLDRCLCSGVTCCMLYLNLGNNVRAVAPASSITTML
mmetsp:Transcript_32569/g.47513  ORF Transcript_32569/g.47513 Transcript_32569/m.47513 type:complete len:97 (+) Transcript_32569:244-534(+)